jgi:UDP-glucuronate decarboxylase
MLLGVIGNGFVGRATQLFKCPNVDFMVYDKIPELCYPINISLKDLVICDMIFICLPTPMNIDGSCYTELIHNTVKKLKEYKYHNIIVRSTVPIHFCKNNEVYFMPEFLTERNWISDFKSCTNWIFGLLGSSNDLYMVNKITQLINYCHKEGVIKYGNITFVNSSEAEIIKLIENTYLACKVGFFNELYDISCRLSINYEKVIEILKLDQRIGATHMNVPGHNNKRGYGGTCFPKDMYNLYYQMNSLNVKSFYIQNSLNRNEYQDRKERDWLLDVNRTVVNTNRKIILVTGGAGFIGSNLCRYLVKDTHNYVICLDNLCSGSMSNIADIQSNDNFIFMNHDVRHKMFFPKLDCIYHLACPASPPFYQRNPIKTIKTSVLGMLNILKLCKTHRCKMLFTSTSEVYGDPLENPQKETYRGNVNCIGDRACYDESKRICETMIYEYRRKYNLDLKIVRIFNTYGPGMRLDDGRIMTNIISSLIKGEPITIYGTGEQTRSFCFIDDMINALVKMNNSDASGPINLGNPYCEVSINKLVDIFNNYSNTYITTKLFIQYEKLPMDDPQQRKPDISIAIEKLKWMPQTSLEEGIKKMIEYYCK